MLPLDQLISPAQGDSVPWLACVLFAEQRSASRCTASRSSRSRSQRHVHFHPGSMDRIVLFVGAPLPRAALLSLFRAASRGNGRRDARLMEKGWEVYWGGLGGGGDLGSWGVNY